MKIIFFLVFIFAYELAYSQSKDSPDLDFEKVQAKSWIEFKKELKGTLKKENFKDSTLNFIDELDFNPKVIQYDRKQPEFKLTFKKYLQRNIDSKKKQEINLKYKQNEELLLLLNKKFKVDPKIIVSLWGIETSFGKHIGKLDILSSLLSLAYDGRRQEFFLKEFKQALKILEDGHVSPKNFRGSWAGAFGQTQFMPSTFHKFAIDFDNDKKINLFKKPDALASGANYLNKVGWNNNLEWGEEVEITLTDELKQLSKKKKYKTKKFWERIGISFKNNYNKNVLLRLVIPDLEEKQFFLVSKNFDVILDWNRSNYFALTVFLLSDEIIK
tara:strand:+ start:4058 stop:5041 length:984 start_codon:yes stop_codon:yes gene_type:complete